MTAREAGEAMCDDPMLPATVAAALREYGGLLGEHGITWGEPEIHYVKLFKVRAVLPPELMDRFWGLAFTRLAERHPGASSMELGARLREPDYDVLLRDTLEGRLPGSLAALRIADEGVRLECTPRPVLGPPPKVPLLIDSWRDGPVAVEVDGVRRELRGAGAWLAEVAAGSELTVDGIPVSLSRLARTVPSARLRLSAGFPCRWSVFGADGHGWFPDGAPHRHDFHGLPYFHGDDLVLDVPADTLTVTVTRGMEYGEALTAVTLAPGEERTVRLTPRRVHDAAARGWYGGDMHVHLNWAGDRVAAPADAAAVQLGEDLHVLNLLAGNVSGARVYDREALDHWAGADLPWSDGTHVARMGVEYRNDLLGHVYAFAPAKPPERFHTGFEGEADWPPNADALRELRQSGALLGYSHPFGLPLAEDDPPRRLVRPVARNCSARELVVDAALGLVDSLDVLTHAHIGATAIVYRRLLGAGNRLAVSAGTDTMLSFTHLDRQSSPPGWARVYARVEGALSAASFADAVRRGRTFATTGPWLELSVDGQEPGAVLDLALGSEVGVTARVVGAEVSELRLRTADGVLAVSEGQSLTASLRVSSPTYVLAEAVGGPCPRSMTGETYALTSPVYVEVEGAGVARHEDVRWCLDWLDALEELLREHAVLRTPEQLGDHLGLLERAREVYRARLRAT
ncbi:CehA/McbA family metallohydrolase [Nonomuraea mangrovi]|uniref:CehA/McbA family metallohydrolase n=1 Tax=Nonomuraea mangrovi TaxID=2316207 RepID=A0ABW4T924_9ACTN